MIDTKVVDFFAHQCGARDKLIAEREVVLTYALHLLSRRGVLDRLAFKGGTALRKLVFGAGGRFSEDLDFTLRAGAKEDAALALLDALDGKTHYGITFGTTDFYETDGSFATFVTYRHSWNDRGRFKLDVSTREAPTLPVVPRSHVKQPYFAELEFGPPPAVAALDPIEMIAEKARAAFQRAKVRDVYDLFLYATLPGTKAFDVECLRALVVLKLWQVREPEPFGAALFAKLRSGRYDWNELNHLLPPGKTVEVGHLLTTLEDRFQSVAMLTDLERRVVADSPSGWNHALVEELRAHILNRANRQ
ncbi:MAG: nucleotidyl transferase AbiEii/AbiGii toxin family protein [Polyangiaceae bacterium]|jgi:predicted nucleotidyltransferase component of viral defense system